MFLFFPNSDIVEHMVQHFKTQIFGDRKPVYDGRKNLYTAMPLPIGREKVSLDLLKKSHDSPIRITWLIICALGLQYSTDCV